MKGRIKKDITVRFIPNLLEDKNRTLQSFPYSRQWTIRRYLKKSGVCFENMRIIVNGNEIKSLRQHLQSGDEIIITSYIEDPVGFIYGVASAFIEHWFTYTVYAMTIASTAYSVYTALANKPKLPSFDTLGEGMDEGSPSHSWTGVKTVREPGGSIPIIYGRYLTGGTIINEYITTDGDKNYLNSLVAIGEGKFRSIILKRINRNPSENFSNWTIETRLGTNNQTVIPNFEDLHNIHSLNVPLTKNNPYIYTTVASDVEAFEIRLTLPSGLFQQNSNGNILSWDVIYKVEYKLHTGPTYTDLGSTTISTKSRSEVRRIFRKNGLTAGQYDIRITRTSDDSSLDPMKNGDLYLSGVDEINTDDLEYPNTALAGIRTLAIEQLSGDSPEYEFEAEREVLVPKVMYGGAEVDWEDYYWDGATEKYKRFSDNAVCTWDGATYVEKFCANPIWCTYNLMTKTRYGIGNYITTDDHDLSYLLEISQYCEEKVPDGKGGWEKRFRMDVCIDSPQKALALIMQLSTIFRGLPFYSDNGKIRIAIDKPDTPVQLFGMGNIVKDSFSQNWTSKRDIPNIVYVQYDNKDNYYQQESIQVVDPGALEAGKPINKKEVRYYGTKLSYAIRHGRNIIKAAKYLNETITIKAGSGALVRQCGEVIDIAHDVPQWGFSGNVKAGSTITKVKLDREVIIEEGKSYAIRVDFKQPNEDGSPRYEEKAITDPAGTYTEVNVNSAFSIAPGEFDVYSFGELNKIIKPARIMSLKRQRMGEVEIEALEYDENIFDDSAVIIPEITASSLQLDIPSVQNLELTERLVKLKDGTIENIIDVWFRRPDQLNYYLKRYAKAKIYLSDNAGQSWLLRGETTSEHLAIQGDIKDLGTYKIAVISISDKGEEKAIASSPQDTILVLGKTAPPSNITGFEVYQEGNLLKFSWNAISDADLARYIIKQGSEWNTGTVIGEKVDVTEFIYPVGEIGNLTFMIKAVDTSGNESVSPAIDEIQVIPPPDMNFVNVFDRWSKPLEFKLSNLELVQANYHNSGYVRPCLALKTAVTWEEREAESKTWEQQEADGGLILDALFESSGYAEMIESLDLETIFEFKLVIDADYKNAANGSLTIQISYSEDGITYTSFADINADASYKARYLKFKIIIATLNTAYNLYLYDLSIYINAPVTKVAWGKDVLIPVAGKTLTFGVGFTLPPRLKGNIVNGIVGVVIFDNKTKDDALAKVYDMAGSAIGTAEIDWEGRGY